jgi:hypothetical protein
MERFETKQRVGKTERKEKKTNPKQVTAKTEKHEK